MLISALISYLLPDTFLTIGYIPPGLPTFKPPQFSLPEKIDSNGTVIEKQQNFVDMVSTFGFGLIIIPFILYLEHIAVCKAFSKFFIIAIQK